MAHYAFLDENNIVTEVIVGKDENELYNNAPMNWEQHYAEVRGQQCKRTSFNTLAGEHLHNGVPYRKNYAGIGYTYDTERDAFIPPKPYASWLLNALTCQWESPILAPGKDYIWNEDNQQWVNTL